MANQQLVDYIKQQRALGVDQSAIRSALLQNGWGTNDVDEAIGGIFPVAQTAPQTSPAPAQTMSSPGLARDIVQPKAEAQSDSLKTTVFQPKREESVFQPKRADVIFGAKPALPAVSSEPVAMAAMPVEHHRGSFMKKALLSVVILGLLGAAGWFFKSNMDLSTEIASLKGERDTLTQQVSNLTSDKQEFINRALSLEATQNAILKELKLFVVPEVSSTEPVAVSLHGTLSGSTSTPYTFMTDRRIRVNIKNYKDAKVQEVLRPLLGTVIDIDGTFVFPSSDVTVTGINSKPIQ